WIIYPNPVNDKLHLIFSGSNNSDALLRVYSLSGEAILEQSLSLYKNSRFDFSLGHLSEGIYLIQILSANERWQKRIMIVD
ncbi:MAG: T9SS type A sorting domain-containing protein, partial [Bacteroidales bacterium]|nr:T9SS type A sorting domain-containing protein [Bacteroidales bacterium]